MKKVKISHKAKIESGSKEVADVMARLIMGSTKTALKQLERVLPLDTPNLAGMEPKEYNRRYQELFNTIDKAINKAIS